MSTVRESAEKLEREKLEFGELLVRIAQKHFKRKVVFTATTHLTDGQVCRCFEYRLWLATAEKPSPSATRRRPVAQVVWYFGKVAEWRKQDFYVVVFKPKHKALAKSLAAPLSLVYSDRIEMLVRSTPVGA